MKLYKQCEGTARAWIQAAVAMLWLAAGCSTPSYIDPKDPLLTAYQPHSTSLLRHTAADIREAAPHKEAFEQFLNSKSGGDDQLTYRERLSLDHDRHLKIAALDKLLLTAEKSKKPELYLQLAEAHRLRHDFLYETAVNRYLIAREHKTGAGEEPPTLNLEEAQAELLQRRAPVSP